MLSRLFLCRMIFSVREWGGEGEGKEGEGDEEGLNMVEVSKTKTR